MLQDKLYELYLLDKGHYEDFTQYVYFRVLAYDSERPLFDSFDKYIDYCISMFKDAL